MGLFFSNCLQWYSLSNLVFNHAANKVNSIRLQSSINVGKLPLVSIDYPTVYVYIACALLTFRHSANHTFKYNQSAVKLNYPGKPLYATRYNTNLYSKLKKLIPYISKLTKMAFVRKFSFFSLMSLYNGSLYTLQQDPHYTVNLAVRHLKNFFLNPSEIMKF